MAYTTRISRQQAPSKNRVWLFVVGTIVVLLAIFTALYFTNRLPFLLRSKPTAHTTGSSYTKGVAPSTPQNSSPSSPSTSSSSSPENPGGKNQPSTTTDLIAPWGTFANVYTAKTTDSMGSTCNTTPGATCQILFSNGAATKSLDAMTTDAGGAAYWSWTPGQIGLTPGTWHIMAKAVLGEQVKTTNNDPLTLAITQ